MKGRLTTLLAVALAITAGTTTTTSAFDIHSLLNADSAVDANAKPCQLTQSQLAVLLARSGSPQTPPTTTTEPSQKYILLSSLLPEAFAQAAAQRLTSTGYQVCQVAVTPGEANHLPGEVTLLADPSGAAQPIVYYGKRNADTLALFAERLDARYSASGAGAAFSTITNRMEKKAFERLQGAKVIGFFPDPTADPAFLQYQQAARQLSPNPPFFVVHDMHFAHKLKLNEPGQIALLHRAEKSIVYFQREAASPQAAAAAETTAEAAAAPAAPASPVTAAEIAAWVAKHRGYILHELDDTNLYDPEVLDPAKYLFAAVADQTSPLGLYFHKVLTKSIQNISRENELRANQSAAAVAVDQTTHLPSSTAVQPAPLQPIPLDDIEIIWIDLQKYPLAAQKIAQNLNLNTAAGSGGGQQQSGKAKDVHFGLVQVPSGVLTNAKANQWFDVSQLQSQNAEKRSSEEANIALLRDWILTVTDRLPKPVEQPVGAAQPTTTLEVLQQEFSLEPEPVSVRAGGSFVLDCRVAYKAGQCQWSKDGEAVDVEAEAAYQWVNGGEETQNSNNIYDCSLAVSGAEAARDDGQWSCSVNEAAMGDGTVVVAAIESPPVAVTIRPIEQQKKDKSGKPSGKTSKKSTKTKTTTVKSEL